MRKILYCFDNYISQFLTRPAENKFIPKNITQLKRSLKETALKHCNIVLGDRNWIINLGLQFSIQSSY